MQLFKAEFENNNNVIHIGYYDCRKKAENACYELFAKYFNMYQNSNPKALAYNYKVYSVGILNQTEDI